MVLTSSRKKYIHTNSGGDSLLSLDAEKKQLMELDAVKISSIKSIGEASTSLIRQLTFFEKQHIISKWPDSTNLESVMKGMFDRLKAVRDLDKKHL